MSQVGSYFAKPARSVGQRAGWRLVNNGAIMAPFARCRALTAVSTDGSALLVV
ncbi:hypothetical protein SSPSH_001754 [Salinisphaera shabanensis E1L3A]|uniref:Uncharacterized protein n=1 Tax=Salinisphaera shabanensis E1L3A TaxID=1033802 RepID=U2ENE8_9GAMM|nr:hypothetical protein SSPSH_001754 [Salinisphaera shabanensis E1L3A]